MNNFEQIPSFTKEGQSELRAQSAKQFELDKQDLIYHANEAKQGLRGPCDSNLLYVLGKRTFGKAESGEDSFYAEKLNLLNELVEEKKLSLKDMKNIFERLESDEAKVATIVALGKCPDPKAAEASFELFHKYYFGLDENDPFKDIPGRNKKRGSASRKNFLASLDLGSKNYDAKHIIYEMVSGNEQMSEEFILKKIGYYAEFYEYKGEENVIEESSGMFDAEYKDPETSVQEALIDELKNKGTEKSIDFFIKNISNPYYFVFLRKQIVDLVKTIDKNYFEKKCLEKFASENEKIISKTNCDNCGESFGISDRHADCPYCGDRRVESSPLFMEAVNKCKQLIIFFSDVLSTEHARDKLDKFIEEKCEAGNKKEADNLEYSQSFITPNHDKIAIRNLRKFYQDNIKFEEYKVNEKMNEKEVELLKNLISKNEKVLEMGCGTGRLIMQLARDGFDISGYDFTNRHVEITKSEIEKLDKEADVFQGDWHNNAIKDESLDTVYSLGRNILHDYSIADQAQLFREANRILKKGDRFIFDIPNREKGGYKKMVEGYGEEMKRRGIKNFRYGSIYDSPDGKHFATRYAYSHEDIQELAQIAGFKIAKIEKIELVTGENDENLYYVLKKI